MTVQPEKQGSDEQNAVATEADGDQPVLSDMLCQMIDTLSGFQQNLIELESWKREVESDHPGLIVEYEEWKRNERDQRAAIIKTLGEAGAAKVLSKVRRRNMMDKRLGHAVDPEVIRKEVCNEAPDANLSDCLHSIARNDIDIHLPDHEHHPFERAVFKLPGFKVAAHLGYSPLRAYLYCLMAHLGWGFRDDRKNAVELVDVMLEMYRRYYKLPLKWSLDDVPPHGGGDYWD